MLEIQVLTWDRHNNVVRLNSVNGWLVSFTAMVNNNTNINKTNNHLLPQLIKHSKRPRQMMLEQAQKCYEVKFVNGIPAC